MEDRELEILTLKARAYDLIAMREQAERELVNVNNQLLRLLDTPAPPAPAEEPK